MADADNTPQIAFKVSVLNTYHDYFDYTASDAEPSIGARVWVPFRGSVRLGVVVGSGKPDNPAISLKAIQEIIDTQPLLSSELLALCRWVAHYYQSPLSEVIRLAIPHRYRRGEIGQLPQCEWYELAMSAECAHQLVPNKAFKQHQLIDFLSTQHQALSKKMISQAGFKPSLLKALQNAQVIKTSLGFDTRHLLKKTTSDSPLLLNEEQTHAVDTMRKKLNEYHCFLLYGITGSGKTEVYLQLIATVLQQQQQVLVIVPEIGLTPQLLARFSARFSETIVVIHSHLNETERQIAWQLAAENQAKLIIGTRAAVFAPLPYLGLIVIDEEHDLSLKQMDGVRYSARDTALMRAYQRNVPIVLGSATPSLESLYNCRLQKYSLLRLNNKALTSALLHYQILDIRNQIMPEGLAQTTLDLIDKHLKKNQQVLVFINRRGFSPVLLCHSCGWMADCRDCDSHLTWHRRLNQLICHHCGLIEKTITRCVRCSSTDLVPVGSGTQRIYDYLSHYFPSTPMIRIDRDEVQKKEAFEQCLAQINSGEVQLIVGTQMLTKGHHFPRLTLVVVLEADQGLFNQDFRGLERFGQLLTQVAGRAGRAELPGEILIQTHVPQHLELNQLIQQGYDAFADSLLTMRQQAALPPYQCLALIRAQGKNQQTPLIFLQTIKQTLSKQGLLCLGPAPAPLARKATLYRLQLLVKASSRQVLQSLLQETRHWVVSHKLNQGIQWSIDVDPQDLA